MIVGKDGKKALLNKDGSIVGYAWYDDILSVTDHFAAVKKGNKIEVLKLDGSVPVQDYANQSIALKETDHCLCVMSYSDVIDMFDENLKKMDLSKYDRVEHDDSEGNYFRTESGGKSGIITDTGKVIVPADYSVVSMFAYKDTSYFNAENRDSENNPIDFTLYKDDGTILIKQMGGGISANGNLDNSGGYAILRKGSDYGIFDFNTMTVKIEPVYQKITAQDDHCFAYELNDQQGVKTYEDKDIIECGKYSGTYVMYMISDGRIVVNVQGEQGVFTTFVVDSSTGNLVFSYKFGKPNYYLLNYKNGVAEYVYFYMTAPVGLFDKNGKQIVPPKDSYGCLAECFTINGQTVFAVEDDKVGLIDSQGRPVADTKYDRMGGPFYGEVDGFRVTTMFGSENHQFILTCQGNKEGLIEVKAASKPSLSLDKTAATLKAGETLTLTPTLTPADSSQTFRWTSSDESVATVKDGAVTALKPGTAAITVMAGDASATCAITVTDNKTAGSTANTTGTQGTAITEEPSSPGTASAGKSPATGDNPLALETVLAILTISALAVTIVRKKRA